MGKAGGSQAWYLTLSVRYHAWRCGLFNAGGFGGSWSHNATARSSACRTTHCCDVYGTLVECAHPSITQWRNTMLQRLPAQWHTSVHAWWTHPSTPYSDKRNLMRHLMPLSLHSTLHASNLTTASHITQWKSSLTSFVDTFFTLRQNTPHTTYLTCVPFPFLVDTPAQAQQRRTRKRDRSIAAGYPGAAPP